MAERAKVWRTSLWWAARVGVSATFIAAAIPKIIDPAGFAQDIANYQAFPHWGWNLLAGIVPMIELVGAICLLIGWKRRAASLMLGALTTAFVALILVTILRGIDVSCGCFGQTNEPSPVGWDLLVRDILLLVAIAIAGMNMRPAK